MRIPDSQRPVPRSPSVEEIDFKSLYRKSTYEVETSDGWTLVVTRYQPIPQLFEQPLLNEPLLLVHGFCQNRHAWTAGKFVKNLLFFGVDIHVAELRGHGKSSVALQREKAAARGRPPPEDVDYGWDIDSYFLYDLPAAVNGVKRATRRSQIFLCGHSMGGMLGYGYAGLHSDLAGLITIGSPSDLGKGFLPLRAASYLTPLGNVVDGIFAVHNTASRVRHGALRGLKGALGTNRFTRKLSERMGALEAPEALAYRYVPLDVILQETERLLGKNYQHFERYWPHVGLLANPARLAAADVRWLLREGGEREPRKVIEQFARWIRRGEMVCYRTGYDYKRGFPNITIPTAIIFGDMDRLASVASTRGIYSRAKSDYLLWRPVKGNSHIELTMGSDIRQICYDIRNLMEYAREHRARLPLLPKLVER